MSSAPPFDVCGPLPTGVTVLEASAGTGKTYTIAALAARYVAEGTPLQQLLLVTFTRIATGELSDRVRERLVAVEAGLEAFLAGADPGRDEVVQLLVQGPTYEVEARRAAEANRARSEAEALAGMAGSLLRKSDPIPELLANLVALFRLDHAAVVRNDRGLENVAEAGAGAAVDSEEIVLPLAEGIELRLADRRRRGRGRRRGPPDGTVSTAADAAYASGP